MKLKYNRRKKERNSSYMPYYKDSYQCSECYYLTDVECDALAPSKCCHCGGVHLKLWKKKAKFYTQEEIDRGDRERDWEQCPDNPLSPNYKYKVRCRYCNSDNVKKITAGDRAVSYAFFGLFSNKRGKEWHCNNCGSDF